MFTLKSKLEKKNMFCENEGILFVHYFKLLFSVETKYYKTNSISQDRERNQTSGSLCHSFHALSCVNINLE